MDSDNAWTHSGASRERPIVPMKNFARLVQFAWRYKVKFGLSVGCAAMVALLFFTELGAVYPLLHILFDDQNPKRWMAGKIAGLETDMLSLEARESQAAAVLEIARAGPARVPEINEIYTIVHDDLTGKEAALRNHERAIGVTDLKDAPGQAVKDDLKRLEGLRRDRTVAIAPRRRARTMQPAHQQERPEED